LPRGSAEGVILKVIPCGEADLIVWSLTPDLGPMRALARRGLRSIKRFGGRLLQFNRLEFDFSRRHEDEIAFFDSVRLIEIFPGLFTDEVRFGRATLFAEVLLAAWGEGDPAHDAYNFYLDFLRRADTDTESADRFVIDAFQLLEILGHRPVLDVCASCGKDPGNSKMYSVNEGGTVCGNCANTEKIKLSRNGGTLPFKVNISVRKTLDKAFDTDADRHDRIKFSANARKQAFSLWIEHIQAILGRTPKSLGYLQEFES